MASKYFYNAYKDGGVALEDQLLHYVSMTLSQASNAQVKTFVTRKEVKSLTFPMGTFKAPRLDGFPSTFFSEFWDIGTVGPLATLQAPGTAVAINTGLGPTTYQPSAATDALRSVPVPFGPYQPATGPAFPAPTITHSAYSSSAPLPIAPAKPTGPATYSSSPAPAGRHGSACRKPQPLTETTARPPLHHPTTTTAPPTGYLRLPQPPNYPFLLF
ncbi:extensin-like [Cryptomeria japonica]|uniref:extensin-like n=1 Tax=Cryptomeria japonica TaxID=3369 RepID=UPI0027DA038F|nr:extensin-like [Cryptomeria japonica]